MFLSRVGGFCFPDYHPQFGREKPNGFVGVSRVWWVWLLQFPHMFSTCQTGPMSQISGFGRKHRLYSARPSGPEWQQFFHIFQPGQGKGFARARPVYMSGFYVRIFRLPVFLQASIHKPGRHIGGPHTDDPAPYDRLADHRSCLDYALWAL